MGQLDGKVCVITGGAGSLGLASARLFLVEGAQVVLVDREPAALEQAIRDLGAADHVAAFAADVAGTQLLNQMIPLHRHAKADEIARMTLFLASDQSSFSTGAVFSADGGMSI